MSMSIPPSVLWDRTEVGFPVRVTIGSMEVDARSLNSIFLDSLQASLGPVSCLSAKLYHRHLLLWEGGSSFAEIRSQLIMPLCHWATTIRNSRYRKLNTCAIPIVHNECLALHITDANRAGDRRNGLTTSSIFD